LDLFTLNLHHLASAMRNLIGIFGLAVILAGCGGTGIPADGNIQTGTEPAEGGISEVPNPTAAMAARSGTPLATLQHGHVTYMLKCGECHNYMLPQQVDVDEWEDAMPKMIRHAGLAPEDEKAVLSYVLAVKGE
jgi:hypothetical protein